jgi:hypothetical protein
VGAQAYAGTAKENLDRLREIATSLRRPLSTGLDLSTPGRDLSPREREFRAAARAVHDAVATAYRDAHESLRLAIWDHLLARWVTGTAGRDVAFADFRRIAFPPPPADIDADLILDLRRVLTRLEQEHPGGPAQPDPSLSAEEADRRIRRLGEAFRADDGAAARRERRIRSWAAVIGRNPDDLPAQAVAVGVAAESWYAAAADLGLDPDHLRRLSDQRDAVAEWQRGELSGSDLAFLTSLAGRAEPDLPMPIAHLSVRHIEFYSDLASVNPQLASAGLRLLETIDEVTADPTRLAVELGLPDVRTARGVAEQFAVDPVYLLTFRDDLRAIVAELRVDSSRPTTEWARAEIVRSVSDALYQRLSSRGYSRLQIAAHARITAQSGISPSDLARLLPSRHLQYLIFEMLGDVRFQDIPDYLRYLRVPDYAGPPPPGYDISGRPPEYQPPAPVAGRTGTAEQVARLRSHSWFTAEGFDELAELLPSIGPVELAGWVEALGRVPTDLRQLAHRLDVEARTVFDASRALHDTDPRHLLRFDAELRRPDLGRFLADVGVVVRALGAATGADVPWLLRQTDRRSTRTGRDGTPLAELASALLLPDLQGHRSMEDHARQIFEGLRLADLNAVMPRAAPAVAAAAVETLLESDANPAAVIATYGGTRALPPAARLPGLRTLTADELTEVVRALRAGRNRLIRDARRGALGQQPRAVAANGFDWDLAYMDGREEQLDLGHLVAHQRFDSGRRNHARAVFGGLSESAERIAELVRALPQIEGVNLVAAHLTGDGRAEIEGALLTAEQFAAVVAGLPGFTWRVPTVLIGCQAGHPFAEAFVRALASLAAAAGVQGVVRVVAPERYGWQTHDGLLLAGTSRFTRPGHPGVDRNT